MKWVLEQFKYPAFQMAMAFSLLAEGTKLLAHNRELSDQIAIAQMTCLALWLVESFVDRGAKKVWEDDAWK